MSNRCKALWLGCAMFGIWSGLSACSRSPSTKKDAVDQMVLALGENQGPSVAIRYGSYVIFVPAPCPEGDGDNDNDGVCNAAEAQNGTDPELRDSDHDGLADNDETAQGTSPTNPDSDGDGTLDGAEVLLGGNPKNADSAYVARSCP